MVIAQDFLSFIESLNDELKKCIKNIFLSFEITKYPILSEYYTYRLNSDDESELSKNELTSEQKDKLDDFLDKIKGVDICFDRIFTNKIIFKDNSQIKMGDINNDILCALA